MPTAAVDETEDNKATDRGDIGDEEEDKEDVHTTIVFVYAVAVDVEIDD